MAAGKFGPSGSKMTMKAPRAGMSSSDRAGPSKRDSAAAKGKKSVVPTQHDDSDSDDAMDDQDQIALEGSDDDGEPDTEDEIEAAKGAGSKSKKTAKRKRRATSPTSFGSALEGLLGVVPSASAVEALEAVEEEADADSDDEASQKKTKKSRTGPSTSKAETQVPAILSLAPHLRRSAQSTTLSARAARIALEQKRRREERSHVKDVIGGWGPPGVLPSLEDEDGNVIEVFGNAQDDAERLQEFASQGGTQSYERKLRKVAQRGVVKLFNAIRAAQTTTEDDLEEIEAKKSAASAAASAVSKKSSTSSVTAPTKKAGLASKDSRLADLSKSNFLDLIKKSSKSKSNGVTAK
ncbi:hypothetical protein PHBOTO_000471 [Pseudozyma hubeiensis]|nr:hypothetical protein PHBOTO_000471 [Pseudozyma hubeiensis]